MIRTAFLSFLSLTLGAAAAQDGALADRVGNTGFVQLTAESFHKLTPREQALAYWLSQASIATDPIIYDQLSRFGLRQKRLLETVVGHPQGVQPDAMKKIVDFTKLFWANKGNHNEMTSQKFLPACTFEELKAAAGPKLAAEVDAYIAQFTGERDENGRRLVVRNGYHQSRVRHEVAWSEWNSQKEDRLMLVT